MEVATVEKSWVPETCCGLTGPSLAPAFTLQLYQTLEGVGTERQWQKMDGNGIATAIELKHGFLLPLCQEGVLQCMKQN